MPILDAALAFAITMLLVATAATQLVSVLVNTAELRCGHLQKMVSECFTKEIAPVLEREGQRLAKAVDEQAQALIARAAGKLEPSTLVDTISKEQWTRISTEDFVEYLKRTEAGAEILEGLGDKAQEVFDQLGERYEAIGRRFSASFKKKSRLHSTWIALVLALVLNIDSVHIVSTYLENPAIRAQVVAQADRVLSAHEARLAAAGHALQPGTAEALSAAVAQSRRDIEGLRQSALPVGWTVFPHSELLPGEHSGGADRGALAWLSWVIGIVLTGLLAGLGSPFWYDTIRGIRRIADRVGGPKSSAREA